MKKGLAQIILIMAFVAAVIGLITLIILQYQRGQLSSLNLF